MRWSWGAVSKTGEVYLRVWQDEFEKNCGKLWARLTRHSAFVARPRIHPGWQERLRHVALVESAVKSYALVLRAKDPAATTRKIAGFDHKEMRVGGEVRTDCQGDHWLEIVGRMKL